MATGRTLWERMFWSWRPESSREAGDAIVRNFLLHWFPAKVLRESLSFRYSLWLGTIAAVLFVLLTGTGVILMFLYVPSVERAYASVKDIEYVVSFGWFVRSLHRIAAHAMVAVVFLHMMRVFLTGAYKNGVAADQNRPLNWIIGILLLLATLLLSFTGYLLPWDQLAYWAITVGTSIATAAPWIGDDIRFVLLGGHEIAQNALLRFYVLHCFVLPTAVLLLFSWHMWRVRKDGGLACADRLAREHRREWTTPIRSKTYSLLGIARGRTVHVEVAAIHEEEQMVPASPVLVRRLFLVALGTIVATSLLALMIRAPLEEPANPSVTPNPAKAPWYFLWLQELVALTTVRIGTYTLNGAFVGGVLIPGLLILWSAIWPYLDRSSTASVGVWFPAERRRQNLVFLLIVAGILVLIVTGTLRGPYWEFYWPWEPWPEIPRRF
jgi:quinol-cytochrome oxidoreductase complex cytochrome b subunit